MGHFLGWLLSVCLAFFAGESVGSRKAEPDSQLQQKVQEHMDVIVDETAGIIDDVSEEVRNNEHVQNAEQFVDDVREIAQNTADDIDAHFGTGEEAADTEAVTEAVTEAAAEEAQTE